MTMMTLHPDVEILDIDEGYCCECCQFREVISSVLHVSRVRTELVAMCMSCLEDLADDWKVAGSAAVLEAFD